MITLIIAAIIVILLFYYLIIRGNIWPLLMVAFCEPANHTLPQLISISTFLNDTTQTYMHA